MAQPIEVESAPATTTNETSRAPSERPRVAPDQQARAFRPPIDVIAAEDSILLEMVLPGVARSDVTVERAKELLIVHGIRKDEHASRGSSYHHVETPRGPFFRAIPVPFELTSDPPVELRDGILRIRLALPKVAPTEKPSSTDDNKPHHDDR